MRYLLVFAFLLSVAQAAPLSMSLTEEDHPYLGVAWVTMEDGQGNIWIGCEEGVLVWDGEFFESVPLLSVRELKEDSEGRVWTASRGGLGYITRGELGRLTYHDLLPELEPEAGTPGEAWGIKLKSGKAFIVGDQEIYECTPESVVVWPTENQKRLIPYEVDDELWLHRRDDEEASWVGGIVSWDEGKIEQLAPSSPEWSNGVIDIIRLPDVSPAIAVTVEGDFYSMNGNSLELRGKTDFLIMHASPIGPDRVAVGTRGHGLLITDSYGNVIRDLSLQGGSSTIFHTRRSDGFLWAAGAGGVSRIDLGTHVYGKDDGVEFAIVLHPTDRGAFVPSGKNLVEIDWEGNLKQVYPERAYTVNEEGGGLLVLRLDGLFFLRDGQVNLVADTYFLYRIFPFWNGSRALTGSNRLMLISGEGMDVESHGVKTVDWNQVTSIVQYDERTFWIGTGDQGLYRVIVTGSDPNDLESYRFEKWNQNAAETLGVTWAHVEMLDDQLYLICDTGLYIYNKERNHFFYRDNLGDDLGNNVYNVTVFKQDNDSFWVLYQTGDAVPRLKKLTRYGTHLRGQEFFAPALHEAAVPRSFVVSPDESKIIISGENLVCSSLISELPVISAPEVARILVDGQVVREADIDGFFSSVDIAVASPDATSTDVQYRFRENNEPWTEWSDSPIHHLYDPDDGDILSYQSIASGASISDVGSIALAVNPPVWLKPHSIALYAATVFGGVYCLASAYRRRFMKRLAQVESEHLEELEVVKEKCERDLEGMRAKLMESHEVSQVAQDAGTTNLRVAAHGFKSLVSSGLAHIRVILSDTAISVRSQASLGAMKLLFRKIDINFQGVFQLEDLEKGTVQLENESIELIPFSTEMVECFQMEATAQGVHYNWDFGNFEEVLVMDFYGDRTMLERILFNLIGNALRHSKDGKDEPLVRVYPSTRQVDGKTELTLSIEDNGLGVPEGEEDNIFRKFYTTAEDGSGLGLYLSKLMAESMGGTLRCERSRHGGAAFILSIPFSPPGVISREGKQTPNV